MKILSILMLGALLTTMRVHANDTTQLTEETRAAIKALATELKSTLQTAMKAEGPIKAIAVCSEQAPGLAQRVSNEKGMDVGRTSLKIRNELNAPEAWELAVLEQFERRKTKGEPLKTIEYSEIIDHNGKKAFRYMKAIPADDVCLMCHGEVLPDELSAKLNQLYPNDQATGFKKGDIRGAFTAIKNLD